MRTHFSLVSLSVFSKAACAAFLLSVGIALTSGQAMAGGKDPSTDKPASKLDCEDLMRAIEVNEYEYEELFDVENKKRDRRHKSENAYRDAQRTTKKLSEDMAAETDTAQKASLRRSLKKAKRDERTARSNFRKADFELNEATLAIEQRNERIKKLKSLEAAQGC